MHWYSETPEYSPSTHDDSGEPNRCPTKISFGIILVRINPETFRSEAVLVRGRYSYEYAEFIHGNYPDKRAACELLDAMSMEERLDIYSLNFNQMWYRVWLMSGRREFFNKKFAKFWTTWMRDDSGDYLRQLIRSSRSHPGGNSRWEFPKGRRASFHEPALSCAIREFEEETGISKQDYLVLPECKHRISFTHMGTRYNYIYYVAVARRDLEPQINLRTLNQVSEVSEVRWMNIEQIRYIDTPARLLEATIRPAFKQVRHYIRGHMQSLNLSRFAQNCGMPPPWSKLTKFTSQGPGYRTLDKSIDSVVDTSLCPTLNAPVSDYTPGTPKYSTSDSPDRVSDTPEGRASDASPDHVSDTLEGRASDTPEGRASDMPEGRASDTPEDRVLDTPEDRALDTPEDRALDTPEDRALDTPEDRALGLCN
jgi:8-oxo-dGTP pyrophosphatase MutT (NUDIX family)